MTAGPGRHGPVLYREEQRFSPRLLGLIWASTFVLSFLIGLALPPGAERPVWVMPAVVLGPIVLLYAVCVLRTEVRGSTLRVRLWPFPGLVAPAERIRAVEAVEYRPLRDFGGWGWRSGPKGTAYSASGNRAVRLEIEDRSPVYIGSARPDELAAVLRRLQGASST